MNFSPLFVSKPSKETILFVDDKTAENILLTGGISKLVPEKYSMICSIEKTAAEISELIERLMTTIVFENIEIFLCEKINKFSSQIKAIASFEEFGITKIYTTDSNDKGTNLPYNLQNRITFCPSFAVKLTDSISLYTSLNFNVLEEIAALQESSVESLKTTIQSFISPKFTYNSYSVGSLSYDMCSYFDKLKKGEPNAALLIIDRVFFSTPLFSESDSLLDQAAKCNLFSTLRDTDFLDVELTKGPEELKKQIQSLIGSKETTVASMSIAWSKLDPEKKKRLTQIHPLLEPLLKEIKASNLRQFQDMLMQGDSIDDVICGTGFRESLSLIGFKKLFSPRIDVDQLVGDLYNENKSETKNYVQAMNAADIIKTCQSGFIPGSKVNDDSLMTLPKFIADLLDKSKPDDSRITTQSGLFSLFKKPKTPSIKSFDNLFIFVLGGLSFSEVREIQRIISSSKTNVNVRIATDSICSTYDIFARKK